MAQQVFSPQPGPQTAAILATADEVLLGGARGGGKFSPLDSKVCTPHGWKLMGDIRVGDQVSDPTTGGGCRVVAIYPQGVKPIYRVTFDDGANLEVGLEHLWAYKLPNHHRPRTKESAQRGYAIEQLGQKLLQDRWNTLIVGTTEDLIDALERGYRARIPLTEPVAFCRNLTKTKNTIPPYTIGVLLGDGHLANQTVTACDDSTREYLLKNGFKAYSELHSDGKPKAYVATGPFKKRLSVWLRNHELLKCRSWEKFIPEHLVTSDIQTRLEVLQGLMDTDGYVDDRGRCYFTTVSQKLCDGVRQIVWSLGGKAHLRMKAPTYTYKGEKLDGRQAFEVLIRLPKASSLFRMPRKKKRCRDFHWNGGFENMRAVESIEYVGDKEAQCIRVSSPSSLYLADDFIVTHNTYCGILWLTKGNYALPEKHPVYATALNYRKYTALVLRRQAQDLRNWVDEAEQIFKETGGKPKGNPPVFEWETGAKVYTDHLNDESAFNKYRGWNLHRILLEELTEIPKAKWYLRLLGSLRSARGDDGVQLVQPQILSTTNPDGPGMQWVRKRFVQVYTKKGCTAIGWDGERYGPRLIEPGLIPPNTLMVDPVTRLSRIFIPALLDDNKKLGPEYERNILAQRSESEATFLAWRYGRWDVFSGQFYDRFRPEGAMPGEPEHANHVYDAQSVPLANWWPTAIGVDWGYNHEAAAYWGRWNQNDKRLYVFREFVTRQMGSRELGREIARRTLEDLRGLEENPHIPLYLSHDAFSKEDDTRTRAESFAEGIEDILGTGSAHLAELTDEEKRSDNPDEAFESMSRRYRALSSGPCITIHRARSDRAAMASYTREMMAWEVQPQKEPDMDHARALLANPSGDGHVRYEEYMEMFRKKQADPVPKVKIERKCKRLIECLSTMVYDDKNTEVPMKVDSTPDGDPGDDPHDAFWYLLAGAKITQNRKPRSVFVGERLDKLKALHGDTPDPALVHQVLQRAHEDFSRPLADVGFIAIDRMVM